MNTQTHRTCIRMSREEYALLKEKSRAAGLSANAWLMRELERNRPMLYREEETRASIAFADEAGRDINAVARALAPEQIAQLELLADKLCEESFFLSTQQ